ncbi:MAG: hypothetical protein LBD48_02905, partial [Treponema sp.]|nr:hypothetical protein [Treponema sp.]
MTGTAHIDKIMTEVSALDKDEKLLLFQKMEVIIDNAAGSGGAVYTLDSAFGLWKDRDITLEAIR